MNEETYSDEFKTALGIKYSYQERKDLKIDNLTAEEFMVLEIELVRKYLKHVKEFEKHDQTRS